MSEEERFLESIGDAGEEEDDDSIYPVSRHERLTIKNRPAIDLFLGTNQRCHCALIVPRYYGELLTWALARYMEKEGWKTTRVLGYHGQEPVYIDVSTSRESKENLIMDGQMAVRKGRKRLLITVDVNLRWRNSIIAEGAASSRKEVEKFIEGIDTLAKEHNFYRGGKLEFSGRPRFLDLKARSWDSIILDESLKNEIKANTVSFLEKKEVWEKYGIPPRRGVLLAGEPGTGKTIICKALMAEAGNITCITTNGYALDGDDYISELYEMAEDLSPCMVFIEDIDLIGQDRGEFGYLRGNALLSLLSVLDGLEEKKEIVTIATTNCLETLDKALSQRPSRFDRVIRLTRPELRQRRELVDSICRKIPFTTKLREYIADKAEGCTPAQLQEIIHSLVIGTEGKDSGVENLTENDVDNAVSRISGRNISRIGFCGPSNNHNDSNHDHGNTVRIA